jgi:hypothetical protein
LREEMKKKIPEYGKICHSKSRTLLHHNQMREKAGRGKKRHVQKHLSEINERETFTRQKEHVH